MSERVRSIYYTKWPIIILSLGIAITIVALVVFAIYDYTTIQNNHELRIENLNYQRTLVALNSSEELMNMDINMAAEAGDQLWLKQYEEHKAGWEKAISELSQDSLNLDLHPLVHHRVFSLEDKAVKLIEDGKYTEANKIMHDINFDTENEKLHQKIKQVEQSLLKKEKKQTKKMDRLNRVKLIYLIVTILIIFFIWDITFLFLVRYRKAVVRFTSEIIKASETLKNTNEELVRVNSELDQLIYAISHQILGPVKSLRGIVHQAHAAPGIFELGDVLNMVNLATEKLEGSMRGIIYYSENARLAVNRSEVFLPEVAEEVFRQLENELNVKDIKFEVHNQCPPVFLEELRIRRIFMVLLANAIQYKDAQKPIQVITVNMNCTPTHISIQIQDNGIGIDKEAISHLCRMFKKLNNISPGPGLGLYNASEMIKKLSGEIRIESELGIGTKISVILPI
jgi:signal transduction histidine kinase